VHLVPRDRLQQAPLDFLDNLDMRDEKVAEAELDLFSKSGGRTLVELTTTGLAPDLAVLGRVSVATGINIIAGTGYYIAATHPVGIGNSDSITPRRRGTRGSAHRADPVGERRAD
jgi:phosphotriesterase-related protein